MPTIEVRFERLVAEAEVRVGDSGLPTVLNSITNTIEVRTSLCPLSFASGRACGAEQTDLVRLCFTTAGGGERAAHTPQQEADHAHPPRRQRHHQATKVKRFPCPFVHITEKMRFSALPACPRTAPGDFDPGLLETIASSSSRSFRSRRMTLLLGPPGSGKTTLLLALAGRLDKDLLVSGNVTYNGHGMEEFVPERTAAYISQHDLHMGEMTVRETLAFSARCQGVGTRFGTFSATSHVHLRINSVLLLADSGGLALVCLRYAYQVSLFVVLPDMLTELSRREKAANIKPDADIDAFMKVKIANVKCSK
jgi:guanylate kinase